MSEQHHGDLLGGAIGETTQTAAQLATIAATAAQTVARVQGRRHAIDHARDQAAADTERAVLRNEHAAARLAWAPAFERSFGTSSTAAAAAVWTAAQPWVDHDPTAQEAARRAEERLAVLHLPLVVRYRQGLAEGMDPVDAMIEASAVLTPFSGDVNGAAAARTVAGDERGEALCESAVADLAATVSVDEHTRGVHAGATHTAASDAASARAALLAAQAYPQPFRISLSRGAATGQAQQRTVWALHHARRR